MIDCTVVSVTDKQLDECAHVIRTAFATNANKFGFTRENYPSSGAFITTDQLRKSKENGAHMFAILHKETFIAFVQLTQVSEKEYAFQKFSVLPEFRKIGLGSILIEACRNKVIERGGNKIGLIMVDKNAYLKDYYTQNGFNAIGTKEDKDHPFVQCIMEMNL